MKIEVNLQPGEAEALEQLAEKFDMSQERLMIQALRVYQAIGAGMFSLVDNFPSPGCGSGE